MSQDRLRDLMLAAYAQYEAAVKAAGE